MGCHSSVSPFQTGTPAYRASVSTVCWAVPRYSMPSKNRPSTRAVSATDSLWPIWLDAGSRTVTCAPWWYAATSNAHRVRVEVFSKISAMVRPTSRATSRPSARSALSRRVRSTSDDHSDGVKSSSRRKDRPVSDVVLVEDTGPC